MERLHIAAADQTPEIDFDPQTRRLRIAGLAMTAQAAEWWREPRNWLDDYVKTLDGKDLITELQLTYTNSKCRWQIFAVLRTLNNAAATNDNIVVNWWFDKNNRQLQELGDEIKETFTLLKVNFVPFNPRERNR